MTRELEAARAHSQETDQGTKSNPFSHNFFFSVFLAVDIWSVAVYIVEIYSGTAMKYLQEDLADTTMRFSMQDSEHARRLTDETVSPF